MDSSSGKKLSNILNQSERDVDEILTSYGKRGLFALKKYAIPGLLCTVSVHQTNVLPFFSWIRNLRCGRILIFAFALSMLLYFSLIFI